MQILDGDLAGVATGGITGRGRAVVCSRVRREQAGNVCDKMLLLCKPPLISRGLQDKVRELQKCLLQEPALRTVAGRAAFAGAPGAQRQAVPGDKNTPGSPARVACLWDQKAQSDFSKAAGLAPGRFMPQVGPTGGHSSRLTSKEGKWKSALRTRLEVPRGNPTQESLLLGVGAQGCGHAAICEAWCSLGSSCLPSAPGPLTNFAICG